MIKKIDELTNKNYIQHDNEKVYFSEIKDGYIYFITINKKLVLRISTITESGTPVETLVIKEDI